MKAEWKLNTVTKFKAAKEPTLDQQLVVKLWELPRRTNSEETRMNQILKKYWLLDQLHDASQKTSKILRAERNQTKEQERKARNHNLIEKGSLLEMVNLHHTPADVLMGAFLELAERMEDAEYVDRLQRRGAPFLIQRNLERQEQERAQREAKQAAAEKAKRDRADAKAQPQPEPVAEPEPGPVVTQSDPVDELYFQQRGGNESLI